jgi:hypothetical protein
MDSGIMAFSCLVLVRCRCDDASFGCDGTPDKIDKRSRYSRRGENRCVTSDNFFITS